MQVLLPHQKSAVDLLQRNCLLADDAGLGKTLVAIEAAKQSASGPILVVCPRSVKSWWEQVIREQDAGFVAVTQAAGRGVPYERLDKWQGRYKKPLWVVTHYEAVRLSVQDLQKVQWDWIIADEAHRVKNRKAKQTRALWQVKCNRRIAMTATPWGESPADLWAILRWLYPKKYTSYWRFFNQYVNSYQPRGQRYHIISGPKNLEQLAKEIAPFYLRRTKDEVLDLPPMVEHDIPVRMAPKQEALYWRLVKDNYAQLRGQEIILENVLVRFVRLQQCSLDPGLMVDSQEWSELPGKVEWLVEWLKDHPDEPVVIVSRFRKFVEKWLEDLAPNACIVGGMAQYKVKAALETFEETGRLVGSLDAICEGLNLQRAATMIVVDGTWSLTKSYQLAQRIHRIGQTKPVQVLHLVSHGDKRAATVDILLRKRLQKKWTQARLVDAFIDSLQEVEND